MELLLCMLPRPVIVNNEKYRNSQKTSVMDVSYIKKWKQFEFESFQRFFNAQYFPPFRFFSPHACALVKKKRANFVN